MEISSCSDLLIVQHLWMFVCVYTPTPMDWTLHLLNIQRCYWINKQALPVLGRKCLGEDRSNSQRSRITVNRKMSSLGMAVVRRHYLCKHNSTSHPKSPVSHVYLLLYLPVSWFFLDLLTRVLAALTGTLVYFSKGKNMDLLREKWGFETILSPIWQWSSSRKLASKVDIVNSLTTGSLSDPCTPTCQLPSS